MCTQKVLSSWNSISTSAKRRLPSGWELAGCLLVPWPISLYRSCCASLAPIANGLSDPIYPVANLAAPVWHYNGHSGGAEDTPEK